ncbi:MAG: FtsX-like permease family protein [Streptomycetales bacterium]
MQAAWLGWRFTRSAGWSGLARLWLPLVGTALATAALLSALAAPQIVQAEKARWYGRAPIVDNSAAEMSLKERAATGRPLHYSVDESVGASWGGRERTLLRVQIAANGQDGPVPPGLDRLPRPGEVVLSPGLAELADEQPLIREHVAGFRVIGTVNPAGLVRPDDLLAYQGVETHDLPNGVPLHGFGSRESVEFAAEPGARWYVLLGFGLFVAAPVLVLLAVSTRLSAAVRERQVAALRLLGMGPRALRGALAVETGFAAGVGSLLGAAAFETVVTHVGTVPFTGHGVFPDDVTVPWTWLGAVVAGVPALAVTVAVFTTGSAVRLADSVRPTTAARAPRRRLPVALFAVSLGLLVLARIAIAAGGGGSDIVLAALMLGTVGFVICLPLVVPVLVRSAGRLWAGRAQRASDMLAARRLSTDGGTVNRLASGFLVLVFGVGVAFPLLTAFTSDRPSLAEWARSDRLTVNIDHVSPRQPLDGLLAGAAHEVVPLVNVYQPGAKRAQSVAIVADCAALEKIAVGTRRGCRTGGAYVLQPRMRHFGPLSVRNPGRVSLRRSASGPDVPITGGIRNLPTDAPAEGSLGGTLALHPDHPAVRAVGTADRATSWMAAISPTDSAVARLQARLSSTVPGAQLLVPGGFGESSGDWTQEAAGWISFGIAASATICAFALTVAAADQTHTRSPRLAMLRAIGTPARVLRRSHVASVLAPLLLGGTLAVLGALLVGDAYTSARGEALGSGRYAALAVGALAAAVLVALGSMPFTHTPAQSLTTQRE